MSTSAPNPSSVRTQSTHRTGASSCRASRPGSSSASVDRGAVDVADHGTAQRMPRGVDAIAVAKRCAAGAISGEWKAPLTLSGTTRRAPASRASAGGALDALDRAADDHLRRAR